MQGLQHVQIVGAADSYISEQSHTAILHFMYLPVKHRLVRMFDNAKMAQILQSHVVIHDSKDSHIVDIQQSLVWKIHIMQMSVVKVILGVFH